MGSCCSKIDDPHEVSIFNGAPHPSLEQWQAAHSYCQLCRANWVAKHLQCCACESCQGAVSHGGKSFLNVGSFREPMCSLCAADVYEAHLHQQQPCANGSDEDDRAPYYDLMRRDFSTKHTLEKRLPQGKHATMQGTKEEILKEIHPLNHDFPCIDCFPEQQDGMHPSETLSSCEKEDYDALLGYVAACEITGNPRRLSNIDDSDGIKLEVRYKHMLPHDAHTMSCNYTSPHDSNLLKRPRPEEEPLLTGDPQANRSIRRRKSFQITGFDEEERSFACSLYSVDCEDEFDNEEGFHDITVGVSIDSWNVESDHHPDTELCGSLNAFSLSHCDVPMTDLQAQEELQCCPIRLDPIEIDQPLYAMSEENLQFINRKEREWESKAHGMGISEDKIGSKMQALSIVSTGDAILFSGANSDELHLIPSVAIQQHKSPFSSPKQNLSPSRIVSPERTDKQKLPLSIEDVLHLLENDELSEDDLFSLLIDSCAKSSASSSPSSLAESTNSWSSPLSSSSSSSSTSSTSSSSMPSSGPLSSTSVLHLPPSPATYSSTLPYSLSLPPSCKMSPHTSFEFTVKSCGSTPSTPVFSPIRSRSKRNVMHSKPSALTSEEIAEIWGVFEQRQVLMVQQPMQK